MAAEELAKGCFRVLANDRSDECFVGVDHHAELTIRLLSGGLEVKRLFRVKSLSGNIGKRSAEANHRPLSSRVRSFQLFEFGVSSSMAVKTDHATKARERRYVVTAMLLETPNSKS
jgi:hypothetical protein